MQNAFPRIEHRWGERLQVELATLITGRAGGGIGRTGIVGSVGNLSLSGALIKTDFNARRHALIEVTIKMPASCFGDAKLVAHIIRNSGEELGIEWAEFAPQVIRSFLRLGARAAAAFAGGVATDKENHPAEIATPQYLL